MLILSGCATFPAPGPLGADLPGPPAYLAPVPVPAIAAGQSAKGAAAAYAGALGQANGRLTRGRAAWQALRRSYARAGQ